jgi:hypothetical protein
VCDLGPVKKSFPTMFTEQHALLFDAAEALGIPRNPEMVKYLIARLYFLS